MCGVCVYARACVCAPTNVVLLPLQSLQLATSSSSVSLQARQGGEWPRAGVLDLLTEAQQLLEELMVQGVASAHPLLQPGDWLTHTSSLQTSTVK